MNPVRNRCRHTVGGMRFLASQSKLQDSRLVLDHEAHCFPSNGAEGREVGNSIVPLIEPRCYAPEVRMDPASGGFRNAVNRMRLLAPMSDLGNPWIVSDNLSDGFSAQRPENTKTFRFTKEEAQIVPGFRCWLAQSGGELGRYLAEIKYASEFVDFSKQDVRKLETPIIDSAAKKADALPLLRLLGNLRRRSK